MNARRYRQVGFALVATLGLGSTISAGTADAQQRRRSRFDDRGESRTRVYDRDRNGRIDAPERETMDHDRNRDGRLSRRERASLEVHFWNLDDSGFYAGRGRDDISFRFASSARQFVRFDHNRDGALSWGEVRGAPLGRHFRDVDRDGDRMISPRELDGFHRQNGRRIQARYSPGVLRGNGYRYEYRLQIGT